MNYKNIILTLSGLWLTFVGLRMVTQWLIDIDAIMLPPVPFGSTWATWDFYFDWLPMVPLGIVVLYYGMKGLYKDINIHNDMKVLL